MTGEYKNTEQDFYNKLYSFYLKYDELLSILEKYDIGEETRENNQRYLILKIASDGLYEELTASPENFYNNIELPEKYDHLPKNLLEVDHSLFEPLFEIDYDRVTNMYTNILSEAKKFLSDFYECMEKYRLQNKLNEYEVMKQDNSPIVKKFFEVIDSDIYYLGKKMNFKLIGKSRVPKYIEIFKKVILHFPNDGRTRIPIQDFNKIIKVKNTVNGKNKTKGKIRGLIGSSGKSFANFLLDNGVNNSHPNTGKPIISATDFYIDFHNSL